MIQVAFRLLTGMLVVVAATDGVNADDHGLVFSMRSRSGQAVVDERGGDVVILDERQLQIVDLTTKKVKQSHSLGNMRQLAGWTGLSPGGKFCFLRDGEEVAVCRTDGFEVLASIERQTIADTSQGVVASLNAQTTLSDDGKFLISNDVSSNALLKVAVGPDPKLTATYHVRADDFRCFVLSSGEYPMIGAISYTKQGRRTKYRLKLLDFSLSELASLDLPNAATVLCLTNQRDRDPLIALGSGLDWLVLSLTSQGLQMHSRGSYRRQPGGGLGVRSGAISPDGQYIATGLHAAQPAVSLWSVRDGKKLGDIMIPQHCQRVDFSSSGRYLVCNDVQNVYIYDVAALIDSFGSDR